MCGIVGAVAGRDVVPVLIDGLRRLEYRGYDSAGLAVVSARGKVGRLRTVGKVKMLQEALDEAPLSGHTGIAHTRWATHGVPSERNAHPHISHDGLAIVHNGIIENHEELRAELQAAGYEFTSETDTEVIAHRIHFHLQTLGDLFKAVRATVAELEGAYALVVLSEQEPDRVIVARMGCPVVIGLGEHENFIASDIAALLPVTRRFQFLEEGDIAEVRRESVKVLDAEGNTAERPVQRQRAVRRRRPRRARTSTSCSRRSTSSRGPLPTPCRSAWPTAGCWRRHSATRRRRSFRKWSTCTSSPAAPAITPASWRSTSSSRSAAFPCRVEIASEYRYRNPVVPENSLFVTISQSGETADTLAALRHAKRVRLPGDAGHLQCAGEFAGARIGSGHADARRPGDRRRLDQGLHHADRRAVAAGDRAGQDPRLGRRARAWPGHAAGGTAGADRQGAGSSTRRSASWPSASSTSITRCSWAAARWRPWRWKAR